MITDCTSFIFHRKKIINFRNDSEIRQLLLSLLVIVNNWFWPIEDGVVLIYKIIFHDICHFCIELFFFSVILNVYSKIRFRCKYTLFVLKNYKINHYDQYNLNLLRRPGVVIRLRLNETSSGNVVHYTSDITSKVNLHLKLLIFIRYDPVKLIWTR